MRQAMLRQFKNGRLVGPRRRRILAAIVDARRQGNVPPSIRDLRDLTGIGSNNGVWFHLKALRREGMITWKDHAGRTLQPTCFFIPADKL